MPLPAPASTNALKPPRPRWSTRKTALILLAVAVLMAVGNFLLLGLPGGVLLMAAMPLGHLFAATLIEGDAVWPAAILLGLVAPFTVPGCYLVAARLRLQGTWRWVATGALATLACVTLAVATCVAGAR